MKKQLVYLYFETIFSQKLIVNFINNSKDAANNIETKWNSMSCKTYSINL